MSDIKQQLIESLEILLTDRKAKGEVWKARAYATAIKKIHEYNKPIVSMDDIMALKLGKGAIAEKAIELLETGEVSALEAVDPDIMKHNAAIELFEGIACIGEVKARELVIVHGITSIFELRAREDSVLNSKQRIGLRYYEDFQARIPRKEMSKHAAFLETVIPSEITYQITGSYRRGEKSSGDIDLLISCAGVGSEILDHLITRLTKEGYLYETLAKGDKKYLGVCKMKYHRTYRRFDIVFTTPETYPFALLYFTGCASFNILMRNHALSMGYSLSEYGLKPMNATTKAVKLPIFQSEEDVFAFLGLIYVPATERITKAILHTVA